MFRKLYLLYGLLVLSGTAYAQYSGRSLNRIDELKNVPKSVRDNPGSYRSIYVFYHHYSGGK